MVTDELTDLMHDAAPTGGAPDLERIHRLGRRRRTRSRIGVGAAVLVVGSLLAGVWWALPSGGGGVTVRTPAASTDHQVTGLTAYEKGVLKLPGSVAVDGTVVLKDVLPVDAENLQTPGRRIVGTPIPLGFHASVGPGYLMSREQAEPYQQNAPKGSQVVIDPGPVWLGCLSPRGKDTCEPTVLVKDAGGKFNFLHGIGTERFLRPGAEMELFTDDDFSGGTWRQTLLGGFHGVDTARVVIELTDGTEVDAQVDVGELSAGNTLFWAALPRSIAVVRAYDAQGELIEEHALRACKDPVDCEVR